STQRLAQRTLDRTRALYEHKAIALKDVQQAEEDLQKATVDLQTAAERIRIIGGTPDQVSSLVDVKAPVSGTIIEQNTTAAEAVKSLDNAQTLFTIADLSRVWVLCDVYENNLAGVRVGAHAEVTLNASPDRVMTGRVSHIARVLDPATRSAKVR